MKALDVIDLFDNTGDGNGFNTLAGRLEAKEKEEKEIKRKRINELKEDLKIIESEKNILQNYTLLKVIDIDNEKQNIKLGDIVFSNFDSLFKRCKIKDVNAKMKRKGGIGVIFGMAKCSIMNKTENNFDYNIVLKYYNEFKENRDNRAFDKCGNKKHKISNTDCDSVNSIFLHCGINSKIKLIDNKIRISPKS